jgi:hypothetical protein
MTALESFNQMSPIPPCPSKILLSKPAEFPQFAPPPFEEDTMSKNQHYRTVRECSTSLQFPFSGQHEPGVVAGISLLLAGCCYVAIALTTKQGASMLRSNH